MSPVKRLAARTMARVLARLKTSPQFMDLYASLTYEALNREQFAGVSQQEKMLADKVRFDAYRRAVAEHIQPGDTVLDVGTGSGVLAFLAATREPAKIFAIDHSNFIEVAKCVAQGNGIENIEFLKVHSTRFSPPRKMDVILHELIGNGLFNENMVETLVDLRERVLRDGGKIIPARFDLYMEPVQLKEEFRVPFIWDNKYPNADFACLRELWRQKALPPNVVRSIRPYEIDHLLTDPEKLYSCDLQRMAKDDVPKAFHARRTVQRDGRLDGFCLFFTVAFDDDNSFSTFPDCRPTHWPTPNFRVEPRSCRKGDMLDFRMTIGDIRTMETWGVEVDG
jgi:predicted RNA methylase